MMFEVAVIGSLIVLVAGMYFLGYCKGCEAGWAECCAFNRSSERLDKLRTSKTDKVGV